MPDTTSITRVLWNLSLTFRYRASFDPPVKTGGSEFYVYKYSLSSAPSKSANMIYHNPLPLALDKGQHASGVPTITIDYTVPDDDSIEPVNSLVTR